MLQMLRLVPEEVPSSVFLNYTCRWLANRAPDHPWRLLTINSPMLFNFDSPVLCGSGTLLDARTQTVGSLLGELDIGAVTIIRVLSHRVMLKPLFTNTRSAMSIWEELFMPSWKGRYKPAELRVNVCLSRAAKECLRGLMSNPNPAYLRNNARQTPGKCALYPNCRRRNGQDIYGVHWSTA